MKSTGFIRYLSLALRNIMAYVDGLILASIIAPMWRARASLARDDIEG